MAQKGSMYKKYPLMRLMGSSMDSVVAMALFIMWRRFDQSILGRMRSKMAIIIES